MPKKKRQALLEHARGSHAQEIGTHWIDDQSWWKDAEKRAAEYQERERQRFLKGEIK